MAQFCDLKLDPNTHDLILTTKDLTLIGETTEAIIQRLRVRLQFFKGEWFLNILFGIPFYQTVNVKGTTKSQVDGVFRSAILSTPGVVEILTLSSERDDVFRNYTLSFSCRVSTGDIIVLEV